MKMNKVFLILCGMISMVGSLASEVAINSVSKSSMAAAKSSEPSSSEPSSSSREITVNSGATDSSSQTDEEKDAASLQEIDVKIVTLTEDITTAKAMKGGPKDSDESKAKSTAFAKAKTDLANIKKDVDALLLQSSKDSIADRIAALDKMFSSNKKTKSNNTGTKAASDTAASDTAAPTTTKKSKKSKKSKTKTNTDTTATAQ